MTDEYINWNVYSKALRNNFELSFLRACDMRNTLFPLIWLFDLYCVGSLSYCSRFCWVINEMILLSHKRDDDDERSWNSHLTFYLVWEQSYAPSKCTRVHEGVQYWPYKWDECRVLETAINIKHHWKSGISQYFLRFVDNNLTNKETTTIISPTTATVNEIESQ